MVRVDRALTDDDMAWLDRHLELVGEYAYRPAPGEVDVSALNSPFMTYANTEMMARRAMAGARVLRGR